MLLKMTRCMGHFSVYLLRIIRHFPNDKHEICERKIILITPSQVGISAEEGPHSKNGGFIIQGENIK